MAIINFVGDIAIFKEYQIRQKDPFELIWLPESDYNIGNFEFIIPNNRTTNFFDVPENYKVDYEFFKSLKLERFNAYSLANNHCMDYGVEGIQDVQAVFEKKKLKTFGVGVKNFNQLDLIIENISISLITFVKKGRWTREQNLFGPDDYKINEIVEAIYRLKEEVDHVVIYPHWGTELVDVPNPNDVKAARWFIDAGASAVIGHHPHVIQGIESYKHGLIAYSLGSFIYLPKFELGYSPKQDIKRNLSLCLNMTFGKTKIEKFHLTIYKLNDDKPVPAPTTNSYYYEYLTELSGLIGNDKIYKKKIVKALLKREIKSFFQRMKKRPLATLYHYFKYLKIKLINKTCGYEFGG